MRFRFAFFLWPVSLLGLYLGSPSAPEEPFDGFWIPPESVWGCQIGYELSRLQNIDLKTYSGAASRAFCQETLTQALIQLNWSNRIEIYGGLGTLQSNLRYDRKKESYDIATEDDFSWEIGGRTLLLFWKELSMGIDVKMLAQTTSALTFFHRGTPINASELQFHTKQWQIGGGFSYRIERWITPYIGMIYNMSKFRLKNLPAEIEGPHKITFNERGKYSLILGTSLEASRGFAATIEAALFGETRTSFVLNFRF